MRYDIKFDIDGGYLKVFLVDANRGNIEATAGISLDHLRQELDKTKPKLERKAVDDTPVKKSKVVRRGKLEKLDG